MNRIYRGFFRAGKFYLRVLSAVTALLAAAFFVFIPAKAQAIYHPELLVDGAHLLDEEEFEKINCKLFDLSQEHQFNVAVVTTSQLGSYNIEGYAIQYFVSNQYGYEATNNGILFMISMDQRSWSIIRDGYGYTAFTDEGLQYISERVQKKLSDGDYYGAFDKYADLCEKFLKKAESGTPYDYGNMPKELPSAGAWLASTGLGGVLGIGSTLLMKRQLKSVRRSPAAKQYIREGSFKLQRHEDIYLYSHVTRVRKPRNDSRSGGGGRGGGGGGSHSGPSGISGRF